MVSRAHFRYVRISPFKVRQVIRLVKSMPAKKALFVLDGINKKASLILKKLIKSAIYNAKNKGYDENKLFISKLIANPGPFYKRFRAATFGRAVMIRKRTSHILVELDTKENLTK